MVLGKKVAILDWDLGRNSAPRETDLRITIVFEIITCDISIYTGDKNSTRPLVITSQF